MTEQMSSKLATQISDLAEQIVVLCKGVTTVSGAVIKPERTKTEIQELVAAGKCINCELPLAGRGNPRRGLDTGCYNAVKRIVEKGTMTDAQAIAAGLWLEKEKGGRPKATERHGSALERYLARLHEVEVGMGVAQGVNTAKVNEHRKSK